MNNLSKTQKLIQLSFSQRLFKIKLKENAIIEVNNLLASKPLLEIKSEEIKAISIKYKVDLRQRFLDRLKEIYLQYLHHSISDKIITDQEVFYLNYLKDLLRLNDSEVEELHNRLAGEIYKKSYNEVISDGKIEESEKEFLLRLQKDLRLTGISEETISSESTQQFMQMQIDKIIDDGIISPKEWEEFTAMAKNLDVDLNWNKKTMAIVEKLRLYWQIEHGDLPVQEALIDLQKSETCHFVSKADWLKNKNVKNKKNLKGQTPSVKIMKGTYYRAGTMDVQDIPLAQLQNIDSGQVILTNKRIHFVGKQKKFDLPLNKIQSISPFHDGVEIENEDGENPVFHLAKNADLFAMTLTRVLKDFQNP